jgi:uncharacterized protein (TIGR03032 family)
LGGVDPTTSRYRNLTTLPGFTRGAAFHNQLAFVGLSQVRESAVFSGIPVAERALAERNCGVWVVHIETGQQLAFLKFEDAVQEIFAVEVLPGMRYPELAEDPEVVGVSYVLPDEALDAVAAPFRSV